MSLTNFTIPFGGMPTHNWATTVSPLQTYHASAVNNLLYGPAGHEETNESPEYYKNNPYSSPQQQQQPQRRHYDQIRPKTNNNYLPPPPQQQQHTHQTTGSAQTQINQYNTEEADERPRGQYLPVPQQTYNYNTERTVPRTQYFNGYNTQTRTYHTQSHSTVQTVQKPTYQPSEIPQQPNQNDDTTANYGNIPNREDASINSNNDNNENEDSLIPQRPPGYTRVQAGQGSRTQVHAVLDYDIDEGDEDYYDERANENGSEDGKNSQNPTVTPIQGPIFLKNGTVPVVPLFSYPKVNNGSFIQIPIWWTALSVALGLDIRGDVIRGVPCIKRYHQLFCPTAGNSYPIKKIEEFIDDNKALMRRMYGDFEMTDYGSAREQSRRRRRYIDDPDHFIPPGAFAADSFEAEPDTEAGETYFGKLKRNKRQNANNKNKSGNQSNRGRPNNSSGGSNNSQNPNDTGRLDACESKIEIVTPYWASNSAGKIRAIVNTQHFEQAIHQEICTKVQTSRCGNDCGCEQKYKWHRLLAYDPDNDCKGIFMDWFLFPSCCVCRCNP